MNEYTLKTRLFDRPRKLILAPDYAAFENKNVKGNEFTRIEKTDITDFRRSVERIIWYEIPVGIRYTLVFKTSNNTELKVTLRSYFGASQMGVFNNIQDVCWTNYGVSLVESLYKNLHDGQNIMLYKHTLNLQGITFPNGTLLNWNEIAIKDYRSYFTIYKTDTPTTHSRISSKDYESTKLWSLAQWILEDIRTQGHDRSKP